MPISRLRQTLQRYLPSKCLATGDRACIVRCPVHTPAEDIITELDLPICEALVVLSGGAGGLAESLKPVLNSIFSHGIAQIASSKKTLFIDGGTDSGVMAMLGQGLKSCTANAPLIGVAPEGVVSYPNKPNVEIAQQHKLTPVEPNHSHLVLVDSNEWGSEIHMMYGLARILKNSTPSVTVLANGGMLSRSEVLQSVRLGFPIMILEGSGRLADDLAALYHRTPKHISNPMLAEIIHTGDLHLCPLKQAEEGALASLKSLLS
jgi:hypothetical protein